MKKEEYSKHFKNKELLTPAYVLDCTELERHIRKIQEIVGRKIGLCYAMKANPFVTKIINQWIDRIEVCSPGELAVCRRMAIMPEDIVFSGVNKTEEDVREAVEYGVGVITIESYKHFELVKKHCEKKERTVNIFLRLSDGCQFGMAKDKLEQLVADRANYKYLKICGIHYFSGTQKKNIELNIKELQMLSDYLGELKVRYDFEPDVLEYGAGLYYPYYTNEDVNCQYKGLIELTRHIDTIHFPCKVVLELGRFLTALCGDYLTTVQDLKAVGDKKYCLVDGGIHQLNYYGQNMAMRTPVIDQINDVGQNEEDYAEFGEEFQGKSKWNICGSLCTFADVLAKNVEFEKLHTGDILIFRNAGAYSLTEAPYLFLSRKMPRIYLYDKSNGLKKIRDAINTDEFIYS